MREYLRTCLYNPVSKFDMFLPYQQGRSQLDDWEGADIHTYVFTHHKNNRFQKKLIVQNTNI